MPAFRHRQRTSATGKTLTQLRGEVRSFLNISLRALTGNANARMGYSETSYARAVVVRGECELVWDPSIPFGDPCLIPGGISELENLADLCRRGVIHFVKASAERIALAKRDPHAVLPGLPVEPRTLQRWGRVPRSDLGLARARPITNPLGLPLRATWLVGAITPRLVLDKAGEGSGEAWSEIETDWSDVEAPPESDPIEEWSEVEAE